MGFYLQIEVVFSEGRFLSQKIAQNVLFFLAGFITFFVSGLLHLFERCGGGLDSVPSFSWSDELSPGELQRLCFARLFFQRPQIAILVKFFVSFSPLFDSHTRPMDYLTKTNVHSELAETLFVSY